MKVEVDQQSLQKTLKAYKSFGEDMSKGVDREIGTASIRINADAIRATPVNFGFLRAKNYREIQRGRNGITAINGNAAHYAPYVEFGTVTRVQVPAGWEDYARQFKGGGVRSTGGNFPQPFFVPAYERNVDKMLKNIDSTWKKLTR